jgi:hypothetical protein
MDVQELQRQVQAFRDKVISYQTTCKGYERDIRDWTKRRRALEEKQQDCRQASAIVQRAADEARLGLKGRFEAVGSAALQAVFGPDYNLVITTEQKRNTTWATIGITSKDNREPQDPLFARGGSTVDIVAMANRLVYLEESGMIGSLLLDEPGRCVATDKREDMGRMLEELHRMTGRQVLMVTHHDEFKLMFPTAIMLTEESMGVERRQEVVDVDEKEL